MRLLLINPRFQESFWSLKFAVENFMPNKRTINPPLGLATLAALTPDDWEIEIVDENIESIPLEPKADIIGICGMGVQFARQRELLTFYRKKGYYVVAGGSYASLCPEEYKDIADTVVAGEAEYIWKEFCRDFERGCPKPLYHETGTVDLKDSPVPRFDLLKLDKYQSVSLQFSRGCPFLCEFCDIIVMFGRKPRTKSLEQVGRELDLLRKLGVTNAFFVDDNLIGNKPVAKELLRFLRDYQRQHGYRFHFGTEASLNMAQDDELLTLFREANFEWVFIGIESPDTESLKETKKFQNTRQDLLTSIRKIYSYGIEILAGFIVGFDNDTTETFEKQYQFIVESGIHAAMVGLLTAVPKTPLYERLKREGRLIPEQSSSDNTKLATNVIPKRMTYEEMIEGYRNLYLRLLSDKSIADRIKNKLRYLKSPNYQHAYPTGTLLRLIGRFLFRALIPGGLPRIYHFLRTITWKNRRQLQIAVQDWVVGLTMRDYVERNFIQAQEKEAQPSGIALLEKAFHRYLSRGAIEVSLNNTRRAAENLCISIKGFLDRDFFERGAGLLEGILKNTPSRITLRIEEFQESELGNLNHLLKRLSRYGDRIHIAVHEKLRKVVHIDSSVFNLVLE